MKTYLLTRVSTEHQEKGEGHDAQLAAVQAMADRLGLANGEHVKETISGFVETPDDRPLLADVLAKARPGDVMVWDKSDRLARDKKAKEIILDRMAKAGVRCIVAGTEYDLANEEHRLILTLFGGFDHYAGRAIVARMAAGKAARARKGGIVNTQPCFGLRYVAADDWQARTFEIIEGQAKVVQEMFDRCLRGQSQETIAEWLQGSGVTTLRGTQWTGPKVGRILRNPMVAGRVYGNVYGYAPGSRSRRINPREAWQFIREIPAIIDWPTWKRVQAKIEAKRPAGRKGGPGRPAKPRHFLKDRLLCECGARMGLAGGSRKVDGHYLRYYKCAWGKAHRRSMMAGKKWCGLPHVPASHVEAVVWRACRKVFLAPAAFLSRFVQPGAAKAETAKARKAIKAAESKVATVQAKIDVAADLLLSADAARQETLGRQLERLEADRQLARENISELKDRVAALEDAAGQAAFVDDNAATLAAIRDVARRTVDGLNDAERRELVHAVLNGLRFKVERIGKAEWAGYRKTRDGRLGVLWMKTPEASLVVMPAGRKDAVRAEAMRMQQLGPLARLLAVGVAFDVRSKAAGCAYRLVPVGEYRPGHALADMARLAKALKPRVFGRIEKELSLSAGMVFSIGR